MLKSFLIYYELDKEEKKRAKKTLSIERALNNIKRALKGSLINLYGFKVNGLIKKIIRVII